MKRREFIMLLGGAAAAWPMAARAQQPAKTPVVGFLSSGSQEGTTDRVRAFLRGLGEAGYVDGRNVAIEYRWAQDQYDRLPALAEDLVRRGAAVIAAGNNNEAVKAAMLATATTPIVFMIGADPVELGLVPSLNRPGGNLTGGTSLALEVQPKRLQFLHELVPAARSFGLLVNPANSNSGAVTKALQDAARGLGLGTHVVEASSERHFEPAFATLRRLDVDGLVITAEPLFTGRMKEIGAMALRHRVPTIYQYRDFVAAGGLVGYGPDPTDTSHQGGVYVGRILQGDKPGDLPVVRSTKIELIINMKTAKALGLTLPITVLGRADEVIE